MVSNEPKDANHSMPQQEEIFVIRALPPASVHSHIRGVNGIPYYNGVIQSHSVALEKEEFGEAGYEHLEAARNKYGNASATLANVDIQEHRLPFTKLNTAFQTSINTNDPAQSFGLDLEEVKIRLQRDGRNILTPPKKKSSFRKVQTFSMVRICPDYGQWFTVLRSPINDV